MSRAGLIALAAAGFLCAQGFEVAAIRVNRDPAVDSNVNSLPGGRLMVTSETLRDLLKLAFDLKDFQIEGAPGWAEDERYDIDAKTAAGDGKKDVNVLVRLLLEYRFALKHHTETRELPVYSLQLAKGDLKMKRHDDGAGTKARTTCGHMVGQRVTADVIAKMLSRYLGRDVHDDTALPGKYDFDLSWTPDAGPCPGAPEGPTIFTAVQQQMGLRLESTRGRVEILVIDHLERPSPN
ncbi:MAG TPA: TIGR03435 family protein [Bryobacteraceae bacterium]|nr:TIGR03435 family protein [Bryobacteraceae bacterium]